MLISLRQATFWMSFDHPILFLYMAGWQKKYQKLEILPVAYL
jgi:hypothetical protein